MGFSNNKYTLEAITTGADIIYDSLRISLGDSLPKDNPNIVDPDLDNPGIKDNPCKNPVIIASLFKFKLNLNFFLWK